MHVFKLTLSAPVLFFGHHGGDGDCARNIYICRIGWSGWTKIAARALFGFIARRDVISGLCARCATLWRSYIYEYITYMYVAVMHIG